ncbi:MAG: hypothetical protein ACRDZ4_13330 [Egibacteraceae bacterium]
MALAAGLTACGGGQRGAPTSGRPEKTAGNIQAYCAAAPEIETVGEPDVGPAASSEEQEKAAKEIAAKLRPIADQIVAIAPPEIAKDVGVLNGALTKMEQTGDFSVLESPEAKAAGAKAHAFDLEHCGWGRTGVTAVDYAFQGVPATSKAGTVSFEFTNASQSGELHEMVLLRRNEGVTEPLQELLALPDDQAMTKMAFVAVAKLQPGDYAMVCFIGTGSTKDKPEGEGPPHFTKGMVREFKVT